MKYNKIHEIIPKTIQTEIRDLISNLDEREEKKEKQKLSKKDKLSMIARIEDEMKEAAKTLDFERAMELRDVLFEMKSEL